MTSAIGHSRADSPGPAAASAHTIEEWPPITAEMRDDGAVEVAVAGITYVVDSPTSALALAHQTALDLDRPVRIVASAAGVTTDSLIVNPEATYYDETNPDQVWPINSRAAAAQPVVVGRKESGVAAPAPEKDSPDELRKLRSRTARQAVSRLPTSSSAARFVDTRVQPNLHEELERLGDRTPFDDVEPSAQTADTDVGGIDPIPTVDEDRFSDLFDSEPGKDSAESAVAEPPLFIDAEPTVDRSPEGDLSKRAVVEPETDAGLTPATDTDEQESAVSLFKADVSRTRRSSRDEVDVPADSQSSGSPSTKRGGSHRRSFLEESPVPQVAKNGWRGWLNRFGFKLKPGYAERTERAVIRTVAQHWPGLRTIAVANPKGSSNKTPTVAMLAAILARHGGSGVLAWDNNETRGSLAWRTESGTHEATVLNLLEDGEELLSTATQSAEMSRFTHHQAEDKYDVLRSDQSLDSDYQITEQDVDLVHQVVARFYRMIVMDSGNNDRAASWRAMIDRSDVLVVPLTDSEETAEAGARMLEGLSKRDEHARALASNAVAIVSQRSSGSQSVAEHIAKVYDSLVREVVIVPFDPALESGVIQFDALKPATQRAWLTAAAAVARRL